LRRIRANSRSSDGITAMSEPAPNVLRCDGQQRLSKRGQQGLAVRGLSRRRLVLAFDHTCSMTQPSPSKVPQPLERAARLRGGMVPKHPLAPRWPLRGPQVAVSTPSRGCREAISRAARGPSKGHLSRRAARMHPFEGVFRGWAGPPFEGPCGAMAPQRATLLGVAEYLYAQGHIVSVVNPASIKGHCRAWPRGPVL